MNEERTNYLHFLFGFSYCFIIGNENDGKKELNDFEFFYSVLGLVDTQLKEMGLEKMSKKEAQILSKAHYWLTSYEKTIKKLT